MTETFFESKKGAAELKHAILQRYVPIFFSKTGSRSRDHAGVYLDGYAGPGTYDDDKPGSPRIAVDALKPLAAIRNVDLILIEKNRRTYLALKRMCDSPGFESATPLQGEVEDHLNEVLGRAIGLPLLAFLDPFGMGLPLKVLHQLLARPMSGRRQPTEILLNVSLPGIYRNAGKLDSGATIDGTRQAHAKTVQRMNEFVGGRWWQEIWRSKADDRTGQIARGYIRRLPLVGWSAYAVPVSEQWGIPPKYFLVLLTEHQDGMWLFNNSVSGALEQFHAFCHREGQQSLENPQLQAPVWEHHIADNISNILATDGDFVIGDRLTDVLGDALGYARERHIRGALKLLYPAQIKDKPTGDLKDYRVRSTGTLSLL